MKLGLSTAISDSSLNGLCDNYKNKSLYRYFVNVLVGCVVGVINYLIKVLFYKLSSFERYKSITREESSLMRKQFYSMFINIGILILFINANFQGSSFFKSIAEGLPGGTEYFFNGRYSDLDRSWYSKVGLAIIVMIVTSLITNVISCIIFELIYLLKRKCFAKKQILQIDMNTCMDGSYFNLSYKYALTMSIFACCIMYCGPIPILIPVCALYFICEYWIDKIFFLRLNKIPAYYSQSIHNAMLKILPLCAIIHCIFSMWAYGSPEMWPEGFKIDGKDSKGVTKYTFITRNFSERLFNENSLPFFILFIVFTISYFTENIVISFIFRKLYKKEGTINEKQPHFNDIKDKLADWTLHSYNPSLNMKYNKIMAAIEDVAHENIDFENYQKPKKNVDIINQEENKENIFNHEDQHNPNPISDEGSEHEIIEKRTDTVLPPIHHQRETLNVGELDNQIEYNGEIKTVSEIQNNASVHKVFDEEEE